MAILCLPSYSAYSQYLPSPPFYVPTKKYTRPLALRSYALDGTKFAEIPKRHDTAGPEIAEVDTNSKDNKVEYLRESHDGHTLKLKLKDYNQIITISVFNLLGKEVLEVFHGQPKKNIEYRIQSWKLPNGVYFCTIYGKDFRLTEKFIVSR